MGNKYKIIVYAYDIFEYEIPSFSQKTDNYIIYYDTFDESKDFNSYDIVILQHGIFFQKDSQGRDLIRRDELIQREKEIMSLIRKGKTFCFLYDSIPAHVPIAGRPGRVPAYYDLTQCFLSVNILNRS
ncbi:unnamed protein product, partial [marine sediment metagenome]